MWMNRNWGAWRRARACGLRGMRCGQRVTGIVEKLPTEVIALGTRQVGEGLCTGQSMRQLVPGTNGNEFVLTQVAQNALTTPKAAVRRDGPTGVFLRQKDNTLKW